MIATSTLHLLDDKYPEPDTYAEIKETFRMIGGEAANSSIVLSRLGVKVKLDGNWLGKDEKGSFLLDLLRSYQIDASRLTLAENYRGVEETVYADNTSRTNFGTYRKLLFTDKQWNTPNIEDISTCEVVCLDPFFHEESKLVVEYCKELSKPYITIDCSYDDMISKNAAINIISGEFRHRDFRDVPKEELFHRYIENSNGLVIFTSGSSDLLFGRKGQPIKRAKPYKIQAVDTAGAGDSFRSGILYGFLQKWEDEKTIDFASAVAACICRTFPGVLNSPTLDEVLHFMKDYRQIEC